MIKITSSLSINESEIREDFIRASGPGGQNVNKVSTAVQLRFNVRESPSLPQDVKERLIKIAGRRILENGDIIINARRFREQHKNRQDALDRLTDLIRHAAERPLRRIKTSPTTASKEQRIKSKHHKSGIKKMRKNLESE